jgi:hypothetical protein
LRPSHRIRLIGVSDLVKKRRRGITTIGVAIHPDGCSESRAAAREAVVDPLSTDEFLEVNLLLLSFVNGEFRKFGDYRLVGRVTLAKYVENALHIPRAIRTA